MRIAGSNRYLLNPSEKETLDRMAKDGTLVDDVEEGEISDGSVEEITEEDFKQDGRSTRSRVWMGDLMNFPVSGNYSSNLYNFAWARAVQNKPLVDFDLDLKPMKDSRNTVKEEPCDVIIEDSSDESSSRMEKEEGELEEGEIELGSEMVAGEKSDLSSDKQDKESEEIDLDSRVSLILEELETVTEEAETSFEGACSRLQKSLESLKLMVSEDRVPVVDALVQQALMGIQKVDSVYTSGNLMQKEQNKDPFSRLLTHIKNQFVVLFTTEQMKEIESMVDSMISEAVGKEEKEVHIGSGANMNCSANLAEKPDTSLISLEKPCLEPRSVASVGCSIGKTGLANLESLIIPRSRVEFSPLLDLHADHDEGSLPSPTRENAPPLPIWKPIGIGEVAVTPNQSMTSKNVKSEEATLHPYVTDALKAVSTYQQKYARTTFLQSSRLPSPTPSEECNDDDGDPHGEVSSSSAAGDVRSINSSVPLQLVGSSSGAFEDSSSGHLLAPASTVGQLGLGQLPVIKASAKSRDPRLRFVNSEVNGALDPNRRPNFVDSNAPKNGLIGGILTSRKHKAVDESVLDGHTLKRQRNGFANLRDVQVTSGRGGWLEESSRVASQLSDRIQLNENVLVETRKLVNGVVTSGERLDANTKFNGANSVVEQIPVASTATAVSLPSLLKDIAVNPTMLMNLIKMEQQRLAAESQQKNGDSASDKTQLSGVSKLPGGVSLVNGASRKTSELAQKPAGNPQMPPQTASMNSQNDMGRVRMKPRDPRRILHNNMVQKNESSGPEQTKVNGTISSDTQSNKEYLTVREQGEQAQTPGLASQSTPPPDITGQFTKKLKNLADILSGSQVTGTTPAVPPNISQPIPSKTNKMDVRPAMTDLNDQKFASGMTCEGGTTGASQLPNPWGDLDHLLDGYDDQQKAAIQRERARRIDEQNKMFAARKLCLVLDLDHTLLNSAKFLEVDQVHDEILRNKEEQDREKPQRHLFRFHHMGMWTKLRPGIWNFLEKASKLYELHLYTMGNKLYATEMAKVLDPTGALFAGRVLSRGDDNDPFDGDERVPKSKDLEGVLGMESAVVIIDDSVRVWPHNKLNLIVVERYTYFPCSRRQFGLLGPSLLEIDHDERPEDGTLASCLTVIERIHSNFFSHRSLNDVDVRNILASEQRNILSGCRIVFSRVFPVGEANPHMHPLWQTAEQFGAACTNQIDDQVTHVVANSRGTDKVNWALSTGRFVVHPGWVEASALLYRRANEHDFAVKL